MAGIKLEQNIGDCKEQTLSGTGSAEDDNNSLAGKSRVRLGEIKPDELNRHLPPSTSHLSQSSESAVLEGEELSIFAGNSAEMQDRRQESCETWSQVQAPTLGKKQMSPCQGYAVVISSDLRQRWRQTGLEQNLSSDSKIAAFLLLRYEESRSKSFEDSHLCSSCQTPLTFICLTCHPAQARYKDDSLLSTACSGNDESIHHVADDSDDDVLATINPSKDKLPVIESMNDRTSLEKSHDNLSTALILGDNESFSCCTDSEEVSSVGENAEETISDSCFVKIVDISSEQFLKRQLQREGLLLPSEAGKLKVSKFKRAAQHSKTKVRKKTKSVRVDKQAETLSQDSEAGEKEFMKKKRGRPRKEREHLPETLEQEEKPFKCSVCFLSFKDRSNCRGHERRHTKEGKPYRCEHCPATFHSQGNLIAHCRRHTGERPFCCEVCGKSFARSTTLEQHKRIHTNDRPYKCEECGESFRQRGMVTVHRRKVHTFERPFGCNVCGATFVVKGHLQVHMQSHTGHRPYLCEECGASFRQKGILETHKMIHTGVRPFSCDICCKSFYRQVDVRSHKKTHFNIRNVICTMCGAAFGSNSTLKRHMQKHTGHRPFKCSECGKNFASNSELKVHLRIHSGDKPYICDVCKRGFQTMGNMKKHRKNRHKQAPPYVASSLKTGAQTHEDQNVKLGVFSDSGSDILLEHNQKTDILVPDEERQTFLSVDCCKEDASSEWKEISASDS